MMIVLIFPIIPFPSTSAQSAGNLWKVEATLEVEEGPSTTAETITGEVELVEDPASGALVLEGSGKGTWTYRHMENENCPALSGDGKFNATFTGRVESTFSGNDKVVTVVLQASPGTDKLGAEVGKYTRSETVTCRDPDLGTTWTEPRIAVPRIIGPIREALEELESNEGITIVEDHREFGTYYKITAKILPPDIVYRIHGTVVDRKGNPLLGSRLAIADYEKISNGDNQLLGKLSDLMPDFEDETAASDTGKAEYEFKLQRPADKLNLKLLVVSLLWHEGDGEFAVTMGKEVNGRYIPVYQAWCVDHVGANCAKWKKTSDGFEAEVDIQYGFDSFGKHSEVMKEEPWNTGSKSIGAMIGDAGYIYFNSYKAIDYFQSIKQSVGVPLNPVMIDVHDSYRPGCKKNGEDKNNAFFDYQAKSSFGGLGARLDQVKAEGGTVTICTATSSISQPDAPINREYHELGHYLQNDMYYPASNLVPGRGTSHAGYNNSGTNDSLVEGFAEFVALLINEHVTGQESNTYPLGGGSLNIEEYKVWGLMSNNSIINTEDIACDKCGLSEELAAAGILWDFHDRTKEIDFGASKVYQPSTDDAQLPGADILKLIRDTKPFTLVDLYNMFKTKGLDDTDMIFVIHGVFDDIVDRNFVHDGGEKIGYTGSSNSPVRPHRESPRPLLNGSYIQSSANATFQVKIVHDQPYSYYDYSYRVNVTANEPTYFEMPPQYYPSRAVFDQLSADGKILVTDALTIDSDDYWKYIASNPEGNSIFKAVPVSAISPTPSGGSSSSQAPQSPSQPGGGGCLIATAAFGSELTPQAQFLRGFRDNHILSTASGSSFMNVFNAWYYSFSPQVADYERQQPWLQQTVRVAIYPLLGILQVAEKAYAIIPGEYGSMTAGLVTSSLIGAVYVSPIVLSIKQVRKKKLDYRLALAIIATLSLSVVASLLFNSAYALMVTTALLVLSTMVIAALFSAKMICRILSFLRQQM